MISFVKELDRPTTELLCKLAERRLNLFRTQRIGVWVLWLDGDPRRAKQWLDENNLDQLPFAIVSSNDPNLKAWNIHPMANNTVVVVRKAKMQTVTSFTDITAKDFDKLESKLAQLQR